MLDSVILIDHFNNIPAATEYLLQSQGESAISVITRIVTVSHNYAEVLVGFESPDAEKATQFMNYAVPLRTRSAFLTLQRP